MTTTEFNGKKLFRWEPSDGSAVFLGSYVLKLLLQVIIVIVLGVTDVDPDFSKTIAYACIITSSNEIAFLLTPLAYGKIKGYDTIRGMGFEGRFSLWATLLVIPLSLSGWSR